MLAYAVRQSGLSAFSIAIASFVFFSGGGGGGMVKTPREPEPSLTTSRAAFLRAASRSMRGASDGGVADVAARLEDFLVRIGVPKRNGARAPKAELVSARVHSGAARSSAAAPYACHAARPGPTSTAGASSRSILAGATGSSGAAGATGAAASRQLDRRSNFTLDLRGATRSSGAAGANRTRARGGSSAARGASSRNLRRILAGAIRSIFAGKPPTVSTHYRLPPERER